MYSYQNYNYNSYKAPSPEPKKKDQVRESMISTVSEAFEFEDFLGETTTMKARIPKNKNNTGKSIVHFSRDIGQEYSTKNPLLDIKNTKESLQKRSTFDTYMDDWVFQKPKEQEYKFKQQQSTYNYVSSYKPQVYEQKVGGYPPYSYEKENPSTNGYLNFKDKNPTIPNSYVSKYNTPATTNTYSNYASSNDKLKVNQQNSYNYYQPTNYSYNNQPVRVQTPTFQKQMAWNNGPQQENNRPAPASSQTSSKKYDVYGQYAKDFTSPDILAILNKRSNKVMEEKSMNYTSNYKATY